MMKERVWDAMVVLARRAKARRVMSEVVVKPRRKRPTTLRSIRETLVAEHYAMLAAAQY